MRRLIPAAVAASVLLAGCSGGDDPVPKVAPTDSSSAASTTAPPPTPSPTGPVEPTLPPEAQGEDAAAAEAFVKYFWDLGDYAQATGDVSGLESVATSSCDNCRAGTDYLKDVFSRGATIRGGDTDVVVTGSREYQAGPISGFEVTATVRNSRQVIDWPTPQEDEIYPAGEIQTRFLIERRDGSLGVGLWETLK